MYLSPLPFSCRWFLINSADRIIRVYDVPEVLNCGKEGDVEPIQKLQDLVNKYSSYNTTYLNIYATCV